MIKVLFESSIFLHQKVGGISKYVTSLNKHLANFNVSSKKIFSPITINDYLKIKNSNIYYFKFKKIPRFLENFFFINNFFTIIYIIIKKPDILHLSYYNNSLVKFLKIYLMY